MLVNCEILIALLLFIVTLFVVFVLLIFLNFFAIKHTFDSRNYLTLTKVCLKLSSTKTKSFLVLIARLKKF